MKLWDAFKTHFKHSPKAFAVSFGVFIAIGIFLIPRFFVFGETVAELQQKISNWNEQIASLEKEIAQFEEQLAKIGADRKTLESEIARLDLSRRKIANDIAVTQNRISATGLEMEELEIEIGDKTRRITESKDAVGSALRDMARLSDTTFAEQILSGASFTDAWEDMDHLTRVQAFLRDEVRELEIIREALEANHQDLSLKQNELVSFNKQLSGQRSVLDQTRAQQSTLLSRTKSEEAEYQKLLEEKREAREQLEADLRSFEAELKYTLDPSSLPAVGSGVLKFPLASSFMNRCRDRENVFGNVYCITQYFGNTPFAQSGAYSGKGHNGIDFGSPEGTGVVSALSGVVEAIGNTDTIAGCYSYGKWVLVRHPNGLTTLYAHLSHISVSQGEAVPTGGVIGYSGNTGYSTGPHLHFTVFASNGVQVKNLRDWYIENGRSPSTACARGGAVIPVAPTQAYVNPLNYL